MADFDGADTLPRGADLGGGLLGAAGTGGGVGFNMPFCIFVSALVVGRFASKSDLIQKAPSTGEARGAGLLLPRPGWSHSCVVIGSTILSLDAGKLNSGFLKSTLCSD